MTARPSATESRKERNERAWKNPDNWIGPRWLGFYKSAEDSRLFVPKSIRFTGWTLNIGHASARWFLIGIAISGILAVAGVLLLGHR